MTSTTAPAVRPILRDLRRIRCPLAKPDYSVALPNKIVGLAQTQASLGCRPRGPDDVVALRLDGGALCHAACRQLSFRHLERQSIGRGLRGAAREVGALMSLHRGITRAEGAHECLDGV